MRSLDPAILAQFEARRGMVARLLVWIVARKRATGAAVPAGFWSGDDHHDFSIGGQSRTYYGAGALLAIDPLQAETGLKVRQHRITLSPIAPEVEQVIHGYDPRLAPVEMHVAYFEPETRALLAAPNRVFKGFVDTLKVSTPPVGGSAEVEVNLLSAAHALTRQLALKKSHESLQARAPNDDFRQYTTLTGAVQALWGEQRATAPADTPAPAATTTSSRTRNTGSNYPGR